MDFLIIKRYFAHPEQGGVSSAVVVDYFFVSNDGPIPVAGQDLARFDAVKLFERH